MSWFPVDQYSEWVKTLKKLTDPYLEIFQKFIPPIGMIDISPIVALFVLNLIENVLFMLLAALGI
jgi:YggT family protein